MSTSLEKVLDTHAKVIEEGFTQDQVWPRYKSYAVTNLRGGVGKSTLAFNLAYEISRERSLLLADLCPQCNFTEILMRKGEKKVTLYDAIQPMVLGPAFGGNIEDFSYRVSTYCEPFKGGKRCFVAPGSSEMFAFPSVLYQQLNLAHSRTSAEAVRKLLRSLRTVLENEAEIKECDLILLDTSPFYAGGTHLAWCAVEALIVPVRVDEHSLASLELMMGLLADESKDFMVWNDRAGGLQSPKIAAIVMTMVGSKSQIRATPDLASTMFIERAVDIAERYPSLFGHEEPSDAFVLTDDFHSAGRISGAKSIPVSDLKVRSFHTVEGRRLQVNTSATRYQKQLEYLASMI